MRTIRKGLLPIAIVLLGAGSAFATNFAKQDKKAVNPVYRIDLSTPCTQVEHECVPEPGPICTVAPSVQGFGMNESGTDCNVILFEKQ